MSHSCPKDVLRTTVAAHTICHAPFDIGVMGMRAFLHSDSIKCNNLTVSDKSLCDAGCSALTLHTSCENTLITGACLIVKGWNEVNLTDSKFI